MTSPRYSVATESDSQIWEFYQTDSLIDARQKAQERLKDLSPYHKAIIISDTGTDIERLKP